MKNTLLFLFCTFLAYDTFSQNFTDVAQSIGIEHSYGTGIFGGGVSFCDFNNDGLDDLTFATREGLPIKFFVNNSGVFEEVVLQGISTNMQHKSVLWIDFDNDGDRDFHVTGFEGQFLFKNQNGNFQDITSTAGLQVPMSNYYGASWCDFDRDGWLDFFLCDRGGQNRLYRNQGNGSFEDITASSGVPLNNKLSFCAGLLDFNNDGWADIYVAEDKTDANMLLKNLGAPAGSIQFEDVSAASGSDIVIDAMNTGFGDFNNDGFLDIYVTNNTPGNKLLRNEGDETFYECADEFGVGFYDVCWGGNFFDFDNDMDLDLHVCSISALTGPHAAANFLYENATDTFLISNTIVNDTSRSFSNAIGDFNNDGRPDIAINNEEPDSSGLFQNNVNNNHWLKVNLQGTVSNRDGIGSWIEVYTGGLKQVRFTHAGIGYLAQNAHAEHFGLAQNETIDSLRVLWPSGIIDYFEMVEADQELNIVEGFSTAVKEAETSITAFLAYPNPAKEAFFIDFNSNSGGETLLKLYSPKGEEIAKKTLHLNTGINHFRQNVSTLESGIYLLLLQKGSSVLASEKVLILK